MNTWFLAFYFFGALWLMFSKDSPLHSWAESHPKIAAFLFLFGVPGICGFFGIGMTPN
jgi:hypothetical protein